MMIGNSKVSATLEVYQPFEDSSFSTVVFAIYSFNKDHIDCNNVDEEHNLISN